MADLEEWFEDTGDIEARYEGYLHIARAVCFVVGPVLVGFALLFAIGTVRFLHRSVTVNGTIVRLIEEIDHENHSVSYRPVFRFTAADGRTYEVRANSASNPSRYAAGESALILYDPRNPTDAKLRAFFELWGMALVFGIIGAVAIAVGVGLRRYERWLDRRGLSITPRDPGLTAG